MEEDACCKCEVVVVDATKLYKFARSECKGKGVIKDCFRKLKISDTVVVCAEISIKRALDRFYKKEKDCDDKVGKDILTGKLQIFVDEKIEESKYVDFLECTDSILNDRDEEKEDSHVLACAIYFKKKFYYAVCLWTDDNDFLNRKEEIERITGVKVINKI